MLNYGKLTDEAWRLHTELQNAAYRYACRYARCSHYCPESETDSTLARVNALLGRSEKRIGRRMAKRAALVGRVAGRA